MKRYVGLALVALAIIAVFIYSRQHSSTAPGQTTPVIDDAGSSSPSDVGSVGAALVSAETKADGVCVCDCAECKKLVPRVESIDQSTRQLNDLYATLSNDLLSLKVAFEEHKKLCPCPQPGPYRSTEPADASRPPVLQKILTCVYGDHCDPCKRWKASDDRNRIEAECELRLVNINDVEGPKPDSVPAFTLEIGGLVARHRGHLTYSRFKDMEKAILDKLQSQ